MRLRSGVFARAAPAPSMPPGLVELVEGLARDVLRHNPTDVLAFCAAHMEQLIVIRDGRAPPKQRLTLEQKIKRAQEKVRERAEQRRIKYDEDIKKVNQDLVKIGNGSPEEVKPDISSSSHQEKPFEEKIDSEQSIMDTKLKAPVHHEHDLTEALEVEISHKPVEETQNITTTEPKDFNEVLQKESIHQDKHVGALEESNHLHSEKETISLPDNNPNGSLEQAIIKESIPQSHDHHNYVRTRRSVSLKENNENEETVTQSVDREGLEEQNHDNENSDKFKPQEQDNTETEEVNNPYEMNLIKEKDVLIDHNNIEHTDIEQKDMTEETDLEFDRVPLFSNEVLQTTLAPDADNTSSVQVSSGSDNADISKNNDKTDLSKNLSEQNSANELTVTESIRLDESHKQINVGEADENITTLQRTNKVEIGNGKDENKDKLIENIPTMEMVSSDTIHEKEKNLEENKAREENNLSATSSNKGITEKSELVDTNKTTELKEAEPVIIETKMLEHLLDLDFENQPQPHKKSEVNGNSDVEYEKVSIVSENDEKIMKAIDKLEVCIDPIEICLDQEEKDSNEKSASMSNSDKVVRLPQEELVIESEPVTEENDGAITSIDKVLVEEPGGVRDDNDSVPERQTLENVSAEDNTIHMNGTHQTTNLEIMQNYNESPGLETIKIEDPIPNPYFTKEVEILSEIQDDVTNTSEPLKTDLETSSLGKSSSMDDSLIDEGVDPISEVDETKSSSELTQNKANPNVMDLETAAITIQKVFRTFLFKSRESTFDDTGLRGNSIEGDSEKTEVEFPATTAPLNKERRTLGISRMDTVLQTVNEEKSLSLSDDSSLSSAATIIQAHVRGFLTRNRLNSIKTNSSSLVNSDGRSSTSFENDLDQKANKTVLNIHIVPEGEHFLSRDESLLTSMELSLDGSPPTSTKLHPLGYDKSEPRKQLKREDAIQSISPPSNNSGKLSEDIDSVKDMSIIDSDQQKTIENSKDETRPDADIDRDDTPTKSTTIETVIEAHKASSSPEPEQEIETAAARRKRSLVKVNSDEGDVVTPFEDKSSLDSNATSRLLHSGEFHDVVLPTKVSRGDTSVVRGE